LMDEHLSYQWIRSSRRRKTLSLHIKEDGKIVVYTPYRTPESEIERFIREKERWILKKLSEKRNAITPTEKEFFAGEEFLYLGEVYPLELDHYPSQGSSLRLSFGKFILSQGCVDDARGLFIEWYKREAKDKLPERVHYYSNKYQLFPKGVRITSAQSRWGSCSRDDQLCFSWRIMMAPLDVIDYVLLHELAHIKEKNHSTRFWNYLGSLLPDYKGRRRWLRDNAKLLRF